MFKLLTSIVLIGAKIISFDYVLDDPKYEFVDTDTRTVVRVKFTPTAYNSLFRIVEKSPYDLYLRIYFIEESLSETKIDYIRIKELEIISNTDKKNSLLPFVVKFFRDLEDFSQEMYKPPDIPNLHEKISIITKEGVSLSFSKIPLDERIDKKIQIHINMDIIYKDKTERNYNHYIPFKQEIRYGRWFPTV